MKNPIDELVKESEAMLHHLNDDSFDPSFAGRTHRRREALRAAIPAAQLYAERMGEVVEAAEDVITTLMTDNECKCLNRLHKALASLDSAKRETGQSENSDAGRLSPPLTVGELITYLSGYNPDLPVYTSAQYPLCGSLDNSIPPDHLRIEYRGGQMCRLLRGDIYSIECISAPSESSPAQHPPHAAEGEER